LDVPRPFLNQTIVFRATWLSYDDVSHNVYTPEIVVGGVLHIDIFNFP